METSKAILAEIAKKHLAIDTLDQRRSDRLDFHDLAVWSIEHALEAAFQAGLEAAQDRHGPGVRNFSVRHRTPGRRNWRTLAGGSSSRCLQPCRTPRRSAARNNPTTWT